MTTAARLAVPLGLGAIAALLILLLSTPDEAPSVADSVGQIHGAPSPTAPSAAQIDSRAQPTTAATATAPPVETDPADAEVATALPRIERAGAATATVNTAAIPSPRSDDDRASRSAATSDDSAERPIGWCFRTWTGTGPWLAASPPGEPIRGLRTEWRIVANGAYSAWLGTEAPPDRGFSADVMWQTIDATPYRGSRIELSAQLRGDASLVHLFFRPLRAGDGDFGLSGTQDPQNTLFNNVRLDRWVRFSVVGDVATDADILVLGVAVYNRGHARIDDVKLDARAALTTPPTNNPVGALIGERFALPLANVTPFAAPTNLDFEQTEFDAPGC